MVDIFIFYRLLGVFVTFQKEGKKRQWERWQICGDKGQMQRKLSNGNLNSANKKWVSVINSIHTIRRVKQIANDAFNKRSTILSCHTFKTYSYMYIHTQYLNQFNYARRHAHIYTFLHTLFACHFQFCVARQNGAS